MENLQENKIKNSKDIMKLIIEELNLIKEIKTKVININYGQENKIIIKLTNPEDYIKWDYFNYKIIQLKNKTKVIQRYPEITYLFSKNENTVNQLNNFYQALKNKYYLIEKPIVRHLTIIAKLTNRCNLDCQYCYDKPFRVKLGHCGTLDYDSVDHLVDLASKYSENVELLWHGGEPTLPGPDYYRYIYENIIPKYPYCNITTSMQTNGTLLNEKWFDLIEEYDMPVGSSYNAMSEDLRHVKENNSYNEHDENLSNTLQNIYKAEKRGIHIGVIDVLTKQNHSKLIETYEFYKKININACYNEVFNAGDANAHDFLFDTKEDQKEYLKTTIKYFKYWLKDKAATDDRFAHKYMLDILSANSSLCENSGTCIDHYIGINSNGDIYPCDRPLPTKYRMGNILEFKNFYNIYETKEYQNYKTERQQKLNKYCYKCDMYPYCNGGCPLLDIDIHNTAAKPCIYACQIRRLNITAAYTALKSINSINELNPIMKDYVLQKNSILPSEIHNFTELINTENKKYLFKQAYDENNTNIFKTKEFLIFQILNIGKINNEFLIPYNENIKRIYNEKDERIKNMKNTLKNISNNNIVKINNNNAEFTYHINTTNQ